MRKPTTESEKQAAVARFAAFSHAQKRYFLHLLREARYAAQDDAENFSDICFALEELGKQVLGEKKSGLGGYKEVLPLVVPPHQQQSFRAALGRVITARNDKAHTGAYARNAADKAILVTTMLEDVLMGDMETVEDIMAHGVVWVEDFMPLAKVRELMLRHSFSYLPLKRGDDYVLLSDAEVARQWRKLGPKSEKSNVKPLSEIEDLEVISTKPILGNTKLSDHALPAHPELVQDECGNIVGIVTAFDWL